MIRCCADIGPTICGMLKNGLRGLYHFGGQRRWSLYEIGTYVFEQGGYPPELLNGILRHEEKDGPPRIGDVSLNSSKLRDHLAGREVA